MQTRYFYSVAVVSTLACFLSGCVNLGKGTERLPRLYVLTATAESARKSSAIQAKDLSIGVGPLAFPEYLNRPQIVTRAGAHELKAAPLAVWAEPLRQNAMRVMTANMATLTGTDAVYSYPWRAGYAPHYQLQLEIVQFDAVPGGEALLVVSWEWLDRTGTLLLPRKRSVLRQPVTGNNDAAVVAAMSRLLHDFTQLSVKTLAATLS